MRLARAWTVKAALRDHLDMKGAGLSLLRVLVGRDVNLLPRLRTRASYSMPGTVRECSTRPSRTVDFSEK